MNKHVNLQANDGHTMDAYVAEPEGTPRGGLVVVQEIFGINRHIQAVTDQFAKEGFLAVAPALFDRVERGVELDYDDAGMKQGREIVKQLTMDNAVRDVEAALAYAATETGKPAGIVGFCYGGTLAWLAATRLAPAAAVGYYAGQIGMFAQERPRVPVMLHFGRQDDHIPASDVARVEAAHPAVQVFWYDAGHGFNCDMRGSYNAKASHEAMSRTLEFLRAHV